MLANFFLARRVAFGEKNFFLVDRSFCDNLSEGIGDK